MKNDLWIKISKLWFTSEYNKINNEIIKGEIEQNSEVTKSAIAANKEINWDIEDDLDF